MHWIKIILKKKILKIILNPIEETGNKNIKYGEYNYYLKNIKIVK